VSSSAACVYDAEVAQSVRAPDSYENMSYELNAMINIGVLRDLEVGGSRQKIPKICETPPLGTYFLRFCQKIYFKGL